MKIINFIKKYYFVIIFSALLIIFLPSTLVMPALTNTRAIITGMSLDKEEEDYKISLQLITPQSDISNNENLEIIDDTGSSILECFNNLSIKLGKVIGLEHVNIIILSSSLQNEDIMNFFDYLYRNTKITMSTILLQTDDDAEKLLKSSAELNNNSSSSLQNNLGFSNSIIETANITTLGTFFNDYFSFSKVSLIPYIQIPKEESESSGGSGGSGGGSSGEGGSQQGGGGSGGSGGSSVQPLVQNNGQSCIYKNGKFFAVLDKELSTGFSWLEGSTYRGNIKIENFTENKLYNNATINIKVENSKRNISSKIKNGKLILDVNIDIYALVSEIIQNNRTIKLMQSTKNYLTDDLIVRIKQEVQNKIQNSLNYCKENKVDAFKIYDRFYKYNNKEFRKVLNVVGTDYLDNVVFNLKINVHPFK